MITINEIENERIELNTSDSYLLQIVESAVKELEEVKNKTGNKILIINPLYELTKIKLDTLKIVNVLKGIVMNSLKHTSNGEVKISLFKDEKYQCILIEDTGEGISETGLRFIFNKFI